MILRSLPLAIACAMLPAAVPAAAQQLPVQAIAGESPVYGAAMDRARVLVRDSVTANGRGSVGATAFLVLYTEQKVVVAILSNTTARFVGGGTGGRQIAALFRPR